MYLFHITSINSLKQILIDGELKSSSLTGKINQGYGLYKPSEQEHVFFSAIDEPGIKEIVGDVILFFDYKMLYKRSYYISTVHSPYPQYVGKWNNGKDYKLKYPQYYRYTKSVLKKLYKNALSKLDGDAFEIFQQIAIKNKCDLTHLRYIKFQYGKPTKPILKLLKEQYPNVIKDFSPGRLSPSSQI